jgi:hypothetical protein
VAAAAGTPVCTPVSLRVAESLAGWWDARGDAGTPVAVGSGGCGGGGDARVHADAAADVGDRGGVGCLAEGGERLDAEP